MHRSSALVMTDKQGEVLEVLPKSQISAPGEAQRAQVLPMVAEGLANEHVSPAL